MVCGDQWYVEVSMLWSVLCGGSGMGYRRYVGLVVYLRSVVYSRSVVCEINGVGGQ